MASTSKAFKRCVHPCPRYLTPGDTHDLCVFCLGEEHARDVIEGAICVHCELFSMRVSCWMMLDDDDAISLTSSDPAASALLGYAQEEQEMSEGEEVDTEPVQSSCPAYDELLEVMERATARLDLPWKRAKMVAPRVVSMSVIFLAITAQLE